MELLFLGIFTLVLFGLTTLFRKWFDSFTCMTVAIGSAINANLYTAFTHPIEVGNIIFSVDAILYAIFLYMIFIRLKESSNKRAMEVTVSSIGAIIFSSIVELVSLSISKGFSSERIQLFLTYYVSCFATMIVVLIMMFISNKLKDKISPFIELPISLLIANTVYALIYYSVYLLIYKKTQVDFGMIILGNILLRIICIILSEICYLINKKIWIVNKAKKE